MVNDPAGTNTMPGGAAVISHVAVIVAVDATPGVVVSAGFTVTDADARTALPTGVGVAGAAGAAAGKTSGVSAAHINKTINTPATAPMVRRFSYKAVR